VLPTFSRKPLFGYAGRRLLGIFIGFMGWGVWSHHMFAVGLGPDRRLVLRAHHDADRDPTGVKIFNWIATMWGGRLELKTAMLFAIGFIAMFIMGGLSGFMHASPPADLQQIDTYFVVAHIHYVLFGGSMLGIFAGIYYWFPKMTGRFLGEGLGKLPLLAHHIGMNVTFFPMHFVGPARACRARVYTYQARMGFEDLHLLSTIGVFVIIAGTLCVHVQLLRSIKPAPRAVDPWQGATLEWRSVARAGYNFAKLQTCYSLDPMWLPEGTKGQKLDSDTGTATASTCLTLVLARRTGVRMRS
jgi:cytochrome c oxidase subunit 1